ncbi:alpha-1,3-mannosyl-glycoprotein 4-beta-N-acetylglucosaminyltransferase B-like, partial [Elysia marginata]
MAKPVFVKIPAPQNDHLTKNPLGYRVPAPAPTLPLSLLPTKSMSRDNRTNRDFPDTDPGHAGINHYLPHLRGNPSLLNPAVALSKGKMNVSIVIGIPSIRRPMSTYLYDTIKSLLDGMSEAERADTLIFVCLTEPWNRTYIDEVKEQFRSRFPTELAQGLLELVVPKAGFYPNLDNLPPSLGDNPIRVKWRTKQNLDYAFLMMHASTRGQYYLQLEDDVQATKGFITSIKKAIATNRGDWFILEFSALGFIGRLFHSNSVPNMVEFLLMFHTQKPCDWLMEDYLQVRMCGHGEKWAKCLYKIRSVSRPIRPSLFQHLGVRSSLLGKVNKLKDKHFTHVNNGSSYMISNPPVANIYTSLTTYANDIYDAYTGDKIYWATVAKDGDTIEFMYNPPVSLE